MLLAIVRSVVGYLDLESDRLRAVTYEESDGISRSTCSGHGRHGCGASGSSTTEREVRQRHRIFGARQGRLCRSTGRLQPILGHHEGTPPHKAHTTSLPPLQNYTPIPTATATIPPKLVLSRSPHLSSATNPNQRSHTTDNLPMGANFATPRFDQPLVPPPNLESSSLEWQSRKETRPQNWKGYRTIRKEGRWITKTHTNTRLAGNFSALSTH